MSRQYFILLFILPLLFSCSSKNEGLASDYIQSEYNSKGLEYYQKDQYILALQNFLSAIEEAPDNPEYPNNAGMSLLQLGRHDESIVYFQKAIALNDNMPMYHFNLGLARQAAGDTDEAEAAYLQALTLDRLYYDAHAQLGILYLNSDRLEKAEEHLGIASGLTDNYEIENHLGVLYMRQNDQELASFRLRKSIHLNPEYFLPHFNLGFVFHRQGDYASAEDSYLEALRLNPAYLPARFNLGIVQSLQDKRSEAARSFEIFIENAPPALSAQVADARARLRALNVN